MSDRLSEIEQRWAKGKQGPWMWDVNKATHSAHLTTTHSGRIYIMGFRRWGTQSAQPMFQDYERGITEPLARWATPRMAHHPDFDMDIDHPDAQKIAAAPSDTAWLIKQVRDLRDWQSRAVDALKGLDEILIALQQYYLERVDSEGIRVIRDEISKLLQEAQHGK